MAERCEKPPVWLAELVGVPYREGGTSMTGWSCWGPVHEAYRRRGITLPSYGGQQTGLEEQAEVLALMAEARSSWQEISLEEARLWDVLTFKIKGRWHCGLVLTPPTFLHCMEKMATRRERWTDTLWRSILTGVYRYAGPMDALLPESTDLRLIALPHPLSSTRDRIDRRIPAGATILEHAQALGWTEFACAEAWVDDQRVPVAHWQDVRPVAGQALMLRAIPLDSGNGNGKTAIRIVALLAIVAAAAYTGGAAAPGLASALGVTSQAGIGAIGAGITASFTIAGSLEINGLIPGPPEGTK